MKNVILLTIFSQKYSALTDKLTLNTTDHQTANKRLSKKLEYLKDCCFNTCARTWEQQEALIITELRQRYPLKDLLKFSGMTRSTFYYYLK